MPDLESLDGVPVWHPPLEVLDLAELLITGALDAGALSAGALEGGGWLPDEFLGLPSLVLEDAEGTPVARYTRGAGFTPLRPFTHGPARAARRAPAEVRAELPGAIVAPLTTAWTEEQVAEVNGRGRPVVWLAVLGTGRELPPGGLARAARALAEATRRGGGRAVAAACAVPNLEGVSDLIDEVARAYGDDVVRPIDVKGSPDSAFEAEIARARRDPQTRGVTVFFTGLSGSGKSTVAKALVERIEEQTNRTVSLLDGDEVRRLLSAGLGFSRADRDLNIRRIGFVAAEVTKHGGLAVCAPIAPFEQVREQVRAGVEENGDFVLVHVSTSLEECERRDRKGLYAKARQGLVKDFTGISSPYEVPDHPELRIDTEQLTVTEAVDRVWRLLTDRGYVQKGSAQHH